MSSGADHREADEAAVPDKEEKDDGARPRADTGSQVKHTAARVQAAGGDPGYFMEVEALMESILSNWAQISPSACDALNKVFELVTPATGQMKETTDRLLKILQCIQDGKTSLKHLFEAQIQEPRAVPRLASAAVKTNRWSRDELRQTTQELAGIADSWAAIATELGVCRSILEKEDQIMKGSEEKFKRFQKWAGQAAVGAAIFSIMVINSLPSDSENMKTFKATATAVVSAASTLGFVKSTKARRSVANILMDLQGLEQGIDLAREGVAKLIAKLVELKAEVDKLLQYTEEMDDALHSSSSAGPKPDRNTEAFMEIMDEKVPAEKLTVLLTEWVQAKDPDVCERLCASFGGQAEEVATLINAARAWRKQSGRVNAKVEGVRSLLVYQTKYGKTD